MLKGPARLKLRLKRSRSLFLQWMQENLYEKEVLVRCPTILAATVGVQEPELAAFLAQGQRAQNRLQTHPVLREAGAAVLVPYSPYPFAVIPPHYGAPHYQVAIASYPSHLMSRSWQYRAARPENFCSPNGHRRSMRVMLLYR